MTRHRKPALRQLLAGLQRSSWSGADVGPRQLVAMGFALVVTSATALHAGHPGLFAVGLAGPALLVADRVAGRRCRS